MPEASDLPVASSVHQWSWSIATRLPVLRTMYSMCMSTMTCGPQCMNSRGSNFCISTLLISASKNCGRFARPVIGACQAHFRPAACEIPARLFGDPREDGGDIPAAECAVDRLNRSNVFVVHRVVLQVRGFPHDRRRAIEAAGDWKTATQRCNHATVPVAWDDLRVLLAVQRAGSLAKAAKDLGVDKATVGRRLRALGNALGVQLVERVANGYRLSADSRAVVDAAGQIDAIVSELEAHTGSENGAVRVTAPVWFARHVLIPATTQFRAAASEGSGQPADHEPDARSRKARSRRSGAKRASDATELCRAPRGSPWHGAVRVGAYLTARGKPGTREALHGHHVIAYADRITYSPGLTWLESAGLHVAFRATDTVALHDAARAGIGLATLPCFVGDADRELERLPASASTWTRSGSSATPIRVHRRAFARSRSGLPIYSCSTRRTCLEAELQKRARPGVGVARCACDARLAILGSRPCPSISILSVQLSSARRASRWRTGSDAQSSALSSSSCVSRRQHLCPLQRTRSLRSLWRGCACTRASGRRTAYLDGGTATDRDRPRRRNVG